VTQIVGLRSAEEAAPSPEQSSGYREPVLGGMPKRRVRPCIVCGPKQRPGRYVWPLVSVCSGCEAFRPPCDHRSEYTCGPDQLCQRCINDMRTEATRAGII